MQLGMIGFVLLYVLDSALPSTPWASEQADEKLRAEHAASHTQATLELSALA